MKQIIPFVKDLNLNTRISEVTSIALEHNLQMENSDSIVGSFTVNGKYKINDISINEEVFDKEIPFDITLDDKYDASKVIIDIDDFYYEIINDEILRVHIDVLANNLNYSKEERPVIAIEEEPVLVVLEEDQRSTKIAEEDLFTNGDMKETESDDFLLEESVLIERNEDAVITEEKKDTCETLETMSNDINGEEQRMDVATDFPSSLLSEKEQYVTYKVHIVRDEETLEVIKEKYSVSSEELEKYNILDSIVLGTKLIIPIANE